MLERVCYFFYADGDHRWKKKGEAFSLSFYLSEHYREKGGSQRFPCLVGKGGRTISGPRRGEERKKTRVPFKDPFEWERRVGGERGRKGDPADISLRGSDPRCPPPSGKGGGRESYLLNKSISLIMGKLGKER